MKLTVPPIPDPVFHQSVRTRLALLMFTHEPSFSELKAALSITDGNLDAHLKKLSAQGYLHSRMVLEGRPYTVYRLSESGVKAFQAYMRCLKDLCAATEQESMPDDGI